MSCKFRAGRCVTHQKDLICPVARAKQANRAMHKKYSKKQMIEWGRAGAKASILKRARQSK
jgi:hypothetical protein